MIVLGMVIEYYWMQLVIRAWVTGLATKSPTSGEQIFDLRLRVMSDADYDVSLI